MATLTIIYILVFVIFSLAAFAVMQIKSVGLTVKDFWTFIEANQILDKLYSYAERYKALDQYEQIMFLQEAEKVFKAFDKVPNVLWEEEFLKYDAVLTKYRDIKILRWAA